MDGDRAVQLVMDGGLLEAAGDGREAIAGLQLVGIRVLPLDLAVERVVLPGRRLLAVAGMESLESTAALDTR